MPSTVSAFFNVSNSVGKNGLNTGLDTMLVQYMLWHIMVQGHPNFTKRGLWLHNILPGQIPDPRFEGLGPQAIYPFNGRYNPELDKWILAFQIIANSEGFGPLVQDSRIDNSPVGWGLKSRHRTIPWRTIQALNLILYSKCDHYYSNLPNFSDVPGELQTYLLRVSLPDG